MDISVNDLPHFPHQAEAATTRLRICKNSLLKLCSRCQKKDNKPSLDFLMKALPER